MAAPPPRKWRKRLLRCLGILAFVVGVPLGLFVLNGTILADGETPRAGRFDGVEPPPSASGPSEITIVAYNIAKGWAPRGGMSFNDVATVQRRLQPMADVIARERPDFVFLSEVMTECTPCPVNQVEFLARSCGMPYWSFGENYNFGLPFYRVIGGNAVLSRTPLEAVANPSLAGRQPFYVTSNNRRALFAAADIGGTRVLLGSLHNDSYNPHNNAAQVRQLIEFIGDQPCMLAGDFNAKPSQESIKLLRESGRFVGEFDGPPTFPSDKPEQRIDYIFGPKVWKHLETRVLDGEASDHRAVVARFRIESQERISDVK